MYVIFKRGRRIVGKLPIFPEFGVPVMQVGKANETISFPEPLPVEYREAAKTLSMLMLVIEASLRSSTHPICRRCGESFERCEPNDQFCSEDCKRTYYETNASQHAQNKKIAMRKLRKTVSAAIKRGITFR